MSGDLIGRHSDRGDILARPRVLGDLGFVQVGPANDLFAPLPHTGDVRRKNEGLALELFDEADTHHGFACATGQHDHTGSSATPLIREERFHRFILVVTQSKL